MIGNVTGQGAAQQITEIAHNWLTTTNERSELEPVLATELPTLEKGTWRVHPDGTMEATWKLHPNVKWHDGTPFTAADVIFGWEVARDPGYQGRRSTEVRLISAMEAPDPYTLLMRWDQPWPEADRMSREVVEPIPRHLLADLWARDKDAFTNHTYWSTGFVGLGPFKVGRWERGEFIEFLRYDDYHRGRPRLDSIVVRFYPDPNVLTAAVLAEEVDVMIPGGLDIETGRTLTQRWEGTGHRVVTGDVQRPRLMFPQLRPDLARLPALLDARVRRALYQGIDREAAVEVNLLHPDRPADSFVPFSHPYRREVESAIPQYPYDLAAVARAFEELGWTRGGDGVLRDRNGTAFAVQVQTSEGGHAERELESFVAGWRQLGIQVEPRILSAAALRDLQARFSYPSLEISAGRAEDYWKDRLHSRAMAGPSNRWTGANSSGYSSTQVDGLLDRLAVTIPRSERIALTRELVREVMTEMSVMPIYWVPDGMYVLARVRHVPPPSSPAQVHTFNAHLWDLER
jgi:peptide/nickel transport system substrate-binding protein